MSKWNRTAPILDHSRLFGRIKRYFLPVLAVAFVTPFLILFLLVFIGFVAIPIIDPWLDTVCAPKYSEMEFDQVQVMMSKEIVLLKLGDPLRKSSTENWESRKHIDYDLPQDTVEMWSYTADGACWWGDFAWEGRYIYFSKDGKVTGKIKRVHFD